MAAGEIDLIRAVRGLGQGSIGSAPDTLSEIWKILLQYRGGSSFAAEKMLLRMLFKNMNGPAAEQVRRYPLTWAVLAAVFGRVSTMSLAQSLTDVNFMSVLRQTLKELSEPLERRGSEPLGKRKRADTASFDLDTQRDYSGCLQTAQSLFQALKSLLARCASGSSDQLIGKMGAEHVKSLFYATEWREHREMLLQLLALCDMSLASDESYEGQTSWTSIVVALWDLHMGNETESLEVAKYLSAPCASIIRKLKSPAEMEALPNHRIIQECWIQDLQRFLTRHLILPIRALWLSHGGQANMVSVTIHMEQKPAALPVLFDLVLNAPYTAGSLNARKNHEAWVQDVFDVIEQSLGEKTSDQNSAIMRLMLERAQEKGATLSQETLGRICNKYALQSDRVDWDILQCVVNLDPDVFLVPRNTRDLPEDVLQWTRDTADLPEVDFAKVSHFLASLAKGFAVARNFSGFLKRWHEVLASLDLHLLSESPRSVWVTKELMTVVAQMSQSSLNTKQLQSMLDWLELQSTPSQRAASMLILEAVSQGITQDDFIDVAGPRLFALAFSEKNTELASTHSRAARWTIAERTFSWGTLEDRERIWSRIAAELKQVLNQALLELEDTFAASKCAATAWVGSYPNGNYHNEAAMTVCSLMKRLSGESPPSTTGGSDLIPWAKYFHWIAREPRLLRCVLQSTFQLAQLTFSKA
jgi:nucleolar pre-ribosomal-associated protein 2